MEPKNLLRLLYFVSVICVLAVIANYVTSINLERNKIISGEDIVCISAVCLDTQLGSECTTIKASLTHVAFVEDANVPEAKRLVVRPTDKQCR